MTNIINSAVSYQLFKLHCIIHEQFTNHSKFKSYHEFHDRIITLRTDSKSMLLGNAVTYLRSKCIDVNCSDRYTFINVELPSNRLVIYNYLIKLKMAILNNANRI